MRQELLCKRLGYFVLVRAVAQDVVKILFRRYAGFSIGADQQHRDLVGKRKLYGYVLCPFDEFDGFFESELG